MSDFSRTLGINIDASGGGDSGGVPAIKTPKVNLTNMGQNLANPFGLLPNVDLSKDLTDPKYSYQNIGQNLNTSSNQANGNLYNWETKHLGNTIGAIVNPIGWYNADQTSQQQSRDQLADQQAQAQAAQQSAQGMANNLADASNKFLGNQDQYVRQMNSNSSAGIRQGVNSNYNAMRENAAGRGVIGSSIDAANYANLSEGAKLAYNSANSQNTNTFNQVAGGLANQAINFGQNVAGMTTQQAQAQYGLGMQNYMNSMSGLAGAAVGGGSLLGTALAMKKPNTIDQTQDQASGYMGPGMYAGGQNGYLAAYGGMTPQYSQGLLGGNQSLSPGYLGSNNMQVSGY